MSRSLRRAAAALLALFALLLTGCGGVTADDAKAYIQGCLDAAYLGQYNQDYLDLSGLTEEESRQEDYEWNTQAEAEILMEYFAIYPSETASAQALDLVKEIYSHSKYEVKGASKLEDGSYAVTVDIQPIDILYRYSLENDISAVWADVLARHGVTSEEELYAMSDADYEAMEDLYAAAVLDGIHALLPELAYGQEQTVMLQLELEDNVYTLVDTDWQHLDGMIIDYTGQYCDLSADTPQMDAV